MSESKTGCGLDVFDTLAPKPQPASPLSALEAGRLSVSAVALVRPSARRSAPPPPPPSSFQLAAAPTAPSAPDARALLAGSGKAAGVMARAVAAPPPSGLPAPGVILAPHPMPVDAPWLPAEPETVELELVEPMDAVTPEPMDRAVLATDLVELEGLPTDSEPMVAEVLPANQQAPEAEAPPPMEAEPAEDELTVVAPMHAAPVEASALPPIPTPPSFRPPAPLPPPSASLPPEARPFIPSLSPTTVTPDADSTLPRPAAHSARRLKLGVLLAAAVAALGIGAGVFLMTPTKGNLRVYAAGPQGQEVDSVNIYVDGNKLCSSSPCVAGALEPGIHDVYAEAPGFARTATKGIEVTRGKDVKLEIDLLPSNAGFKVAGHQQGIMLEVDGTQVGQLPQTLTALTPGEHKLRFVGSDRYEPLAKTITVSPNRVDDLGEVTLGVLRGRATFELASADVRMRLVSAQGDARELDEQSFEDRRLSVDLDTSKDWKLQACSPGYAFLEVPLSFTDGQADKTFRVELQRNASRGRARLESWCSAPKRVAAAQPARTTPADTTSATRAVDGGGTLNINSVPASAAVLLDGKPIGRTPMSGVKVKAGTHTVVFVHPEKGRKSASVSVGAGQNRGVGVRF